MAAHGVPRATGDMDIFYATDADNVHILIAALQPFGAPIDSHAVTAEALMMPGSIYQLGLPPRRIDLISRIDGVTFAEAFPARLTIRVGSLEIPVIRIEALKNNNESTGREKDQLDVKLIEQIQRDS